MRKQRCIARVGADDLLTDLTVKHLAEMPRSLMSLDDSDMDSTVSSTSTYDEEEWLQAQREWEESIEQLQEIQSLFEKAERDYLCTLLYPLFFHSN